MYELVVVTIVALVAILVVVRTGTKKTIPLRQRVQDWAKKQGLEIVRSERRFFFTGPFFLRPGTGTVFHIFVRDGEGEREGWLDLQSPLWGKDRERIEWESEGPDEDEEEA